MPSITPATLEYVDGVPFSAHFGDVYHSHAGGPEQAAHVFLHGNGLPERWRGRARCVILETGFGFGLNFLATWRAWRDDPARSDRLHFVSVEKHPFSLPDLARIHARYPALAPLAALLRAQWPMLVPGVHRLAFDGGRVVLTLAFADIADALPQLRLAADCVYLDGFAPARNPQMWTPEVMRAVARLCAPGATAATWSAASGVAAALEAAGFEVEKRAGFAGKREMSVARLRRAMPRTEPGALSGAVSGRSAGHSGERSAIVIGAGIAGASVCERLCERGWEVTLIERHGAPAQEASGNPAAIFHPVLARDDSHLARLTRAGFLSALSCWRRLDDIGHAPRRGHCGVLQLAKDDGEAEAQAAALERLAPPAEYASAVTQAQASALAGVEVAASGIRFPQAGWINPGSLVNALLDACGSRLAQRFDGAVAAIEHGPEGWCALDGGGGTIARAGVMVLANAGDALRLAPLQAPLRQVRGQISLLPAPRYAPGTVLLRGGFALPAIGGRMQVGASFDHDDPDPAPRQDSHAGNLHRLAAILPGVNAVEEFDPASLQGRVGFRAVAADRLPLIGPLPDEAAFLKSGGGAGPVPRRPGLYAAFAYASRGVIWSALGAELLASRIEGEPLPLESTLADALDPARFMLRAARRR